MAKTDERAPIRGHLYRWTRVVMSQADRVVSAPSLDASQDEALLFALSLRQLLRTVGLAIKHVDGRKNGKQSKKIRAARAAFDEAVPDAVDVRDIIVHFDEYMRGSGRLQKGLSHPPEFKLFASDDGTTVRLHLIGDYGLDVRAASVAAVALANTVLEALSD
jgi:hypothetical protein